MEGADRRRPFVVRRRRGWALGLDARKAGKRQL